MKTRKLIVGMKKGHIYIVQIEILLDILTLQLLAELGRADAPKRADAPH